MYFDDRTDAARQLADALRSYAGKNPLVLAIPRGGVVLGRVLADALGGELDVVLVRKLRAPSSSELAVGAIDEAGWSYVADYAPDIGADAAYLDREKRAQLDLLERRRAMYTPSRTGRDPAGRIVIVVDDGLATGATMIAALQSARAKRPAKLVCAVPVASRESLARVSTLADDTVCLSAPVEFGAVGQFYREFDQVSDDEVARILRGAREVAAHEK